MSFCYLFGILRCKTVLPYKKSVRRSWTASEGFFWKMSGGIGVFFQVVLLLLILSLGFVLLSIRYVKRHSYSKQNVPKKKRSSTSIRMCCVAGSGMVFLRIYIFCSVLFVYCMLQCQYLINFYYYSISDQKFWLSSTHFQSGNLN